MPRRPARLLLLTSALLLAASAEAGARDRMGLGAGTLPSHSPPRRNPQAPPAPSAPALAAVARRQTSHFVFYNSAYMKIAYPMGDVPLYFGVCTDVVVRAYRALGIDLQVLVHKSAPAPATPTSTIAASRCCAASSPAPAPACPSPPIPPTTSPATSSPTTCRTAGSPRRTSPSSPPRRSPTGVPLVVHNRGWGVQAENWLFAEKITGHFRYAGPR